MGGGRGQLPLIPRRWPGTVCRMLALSCCTRATLWIINIRQLLSDEVSQLLGGICSLDGAFLTSDLVYFLTVTVFPLSPFPLEATSNEDKRDKYVSPTNFSEMMNIPEGVNLCECLHFRFLLLQRHCHRKFLVQTYRICSASEEIF